jgi:hypothetical protein
MWEPFGNTTALPPTQWHPEPQFRGTFSILSSCLITMSLCIWTSLHLNVPEHRKEHLQKYRKLGWMVLGLLAPELVVWNAWEQRKQVKRLSAVMRKRGFMPKETTARERVSRWFKRAWQKVHTPLSPKAQDAQDLIDVVPSRAHNNRLNDWTDIHSWLVVMGGVVLEDKSPGNRQYMPRTRQRLPITPEFFEWLVETGPHLIPDISREYIEDKSKSDWLAKGLTCWQAGYFCIQYTFRLSQQLSITLLELTVFAHAICALLLFLVWWDKPRDVLVPTVISSEEALDVCTDDLHFMRSVVNARGMEYFIELRPILRHPSPDECFEIVQPTTIVVRWDSENWTFMTLSGRTHHKFLKIRDTYWQLRDNFVLNYNTTLTELGAEGCYDIDITVEFTDRDISRLQRVFKCSTQSEISGGRILSSGTWIACLSKYRISDWSLGIVQMQNILNTGLYSRHGRTIAGITFASACYGGLHLIAWTSAFPSHTALVMWRAACVTLLATGPFCVAMSASLVGIEWIDQWSPFGEGRLGDALSWMLICLTGLAFVWYTLCRTFIVVECFILLAHIPESALRVPTWAAYIPSFG